MELTAVIYINKQTDRKIQKNSWDNIDQMFEFITSPREQIPCKKTVLYTHLKRAYKEFAYEI